MLDRDQIWAAIDAQRISIVAMLEELTPEEWEVRSLCAEWRVRDVAAHLTLQDVGWGTALGLLLRYRFDTERGIRESAQARAAEWSPARMIEAIRAMVGSRRHNAGITIREALIDALVHGQDIAVP